MGSQKTADERIAEYTITEIYPHYLAKIEKKGRTKAELDQVIEWLTGYDASALAAQIEGESSFADFFGGASLNPNAGLIKGVVCGVRVEEIDNEMTQKIRYLDKLVDELAKGKKMEKILRST